MTPGEFTAWGTAAASVITAVFYALKSNNKGKTAPEVAPIRQNGYVREGVYQAGMDKIEVVTNNLEKGQRDNRDAIKETNESIQSLIRENHDSHEKLYDKIDQLIIRELNQRG